MTTKTTEAQNAKAELTPTTNELFLSLSECIVTNATFCRYSFVPATATEPSRYELVEKKVVGTTK